MPLPVKGKSPKNCLALPRAILYHLQWDVADVLNVTEKARGTSEIRKYSVEPVLCWENGMDKSPQESVMARFQHSHTCIGPDPGVTPGCNKISRRTLYKSFSLSVATFNSPSFLTVFIARKNPGRPGLGMDLMSST